MYGQYSFCISITAPPPWIDRDFLYTYTLNFRWSIFKSLSIQHSDKHITSYVHKKFRRLFSLCNPPCRFHPIIRNDLWFSWPPYFPLALLLCPPPVAPLPSRLGWSPDAIFTGSEHTASHRYRVYPSQDQLSFDSFLLWSNEIKILGVGPIVGYRNASGDQRQSIVSLVLQTAQWQLKEYFMMPTNWILWKKEQLLCW